MGRGREGGHNVYRSYVYVSYTYEGGKPLCFGDIHQRDKFFRTQILKKIKKTHAGVLKYLFKIKEKLKDDSINPFLRAQYFAKCFLQM